MRLFLYLLLGQLVGDFILQSSERVRLKRVKTFGVYPHVALVTLATALATLGATPQLWLILAFVGLTHLLLDRLAILMFTFTSARQVFIFLADQAAHVGALSLIAWAFARLSGLSGQPVERAWLLPVGDWTLALTCGVIAVAFAGSVFVFETAEAVDPSDLAAPKGALLLGYSPGRIAGMLERTAAYLAAVLGFYPVVGAWALVRLGAGALRPTKRRRRALAEAVATVATVVVVAAVTVALHATITSAA